MIKLYSHQQRFIDSNPQRALLLWETGTGKTIAAGMWRNHDTRKNMKAVIACPKAIIGKWQRDLEEMKVKNTDVISRDDVKKMDLNVYDILILDEAQDYASPLFDKSRSQRASVIYNYVKCNTSAHVLLLSATPVRSTPWNAHTLSCYLGRFFPVKDFRDEFFYFTDMFGRFHYEKRKEWRLKIRPYVENMSDIVLMKDIIDVPEQKEQVITIPWTKKQEEELTGSYQEPSAEWHKRHKAEQGEHKFKELKRIMDGYRKIMVVCYYKEQIENYRKWIGNDREVFVLHGGVNNQDEVIEGAKKADDCVFIIQASMGAGFDASEFSVVVFASLDFKYISMVQMKGRVKRINNLHENMFIYLIAGKNDKRVYDVIMSGKDFDPIEYGFTRTTTTKKETGTSSDSKSARMVSNDVPF